MDNYDKVYAYGEAHTLAGEVVKLAATYLGTTPKELIIDGVRAALEDLAETFEAEEFE